ncbi:MAG: hypothetical protein ACKOYP_02915 [Bacteroidota bacterium]
MVRSCKSGKQLYPDEPTALVALLEVWGRTPFRAGEGPKTVYRCEDCGNWHFTSKGATHPELEAYMRSPEFLLKRKASDWEDRFR